MALKLVLEKELKAMVGAFRLARVGRHARPHLP